MFAKERMKKKNSFLFARYESVRIWEIIPIYQSMRASVYVLNICIAVSVQHRIFTIDIMSYADCHVYFTARES